MFFRCYCYNVTIPFYRMHSVQTSPSNFFNMCKCYYVATIEPCIVMQRHSFGIFQGHCAEGYLRFKTQIKRNYNDGRTGNINSYTKVNNNTVKKPREVASYIFYRLVSLFYITNTVEL